jgi:hypothetical protein
MKPYYHGIIKKAITSFGKLFSDIQIQRFDVDGNVSQTIVVPIAYSNKQKWLTRLEQDPNLENYTLTSLPRLGFEITSYTYDPTRKTNKHTVVQTKINDNQVNTQFTPVPYNVGISLYLQTKNIEDGLQCMEMIIPYFSPQYNLSINAVDDMDIINNIPLILEGVSSEDDYESDMISRRSIIHTFDFTMKLNLFGPVIQSGVITNVIANLPLQQQMYNVAAIKPADVPNNFSVDTWTNINL